MKSWHTYSSSVVCGGSDTEYLLIQNITLEKW